MLETILELIGISLDTYNINDDLLFCLSGLVLLYCLGFMFNFFQTLMERMTAKKGR